MYIYIEYVCMYDVYSIYIIYIYIHIYIYHIHHTFAIYIYREGRKPQSQGAMHTWAEASNWGSCGSSCTNSHARGRRRGRQQSAACKASARREGKGEEEKEAPEVRVRCATPPVHLYSPRGVPGRLYTLKSRLEGGVRGEGCNYQQLMWRTQGNQRRHHTW